MARKPSSCMATARRMTSTYDEALDATGTRDFPLLPIHGVRR